MGVEGPEISCPTVFHRHDATRHVALHHTVKCRLKERTADDDLEAGRWHSATRLCCAEAESRAQLATRIIE